MKSSVRLAASLAALVLWAGLEPLLCFGQEQEVPAPPPTMAPPADATSAPGAATQATVEPFSVAPPADTVTGASPPPAQPLEIPPPGQAPEGPPPPARPKVVLLPAEFTVFQLGVAGPEAVPDWTTRARENLDQAIRLALEGRTGFEIVPMPPLPEPEQKVLDEHVGVARLIVFEGSRMGGKAWSTRRAEFDRQLGPGLGWLRDLSGADYALLVAGSQYEQSGGLVFAQVLAAAAGIIMSPGGGTNVSVALIDLAAGEVKWFNSTLGVEILGMGSIDFRKPETSAQALRELIAPYPRIPSLEPKP